MKTHTLFIIILFTSFCANAQHVEWIKADPVHYQLNPGLVFHTINACANGNVISARMDTSSLVYGSEVFGSVIVESIDASSHAQWTFLISDSVSIRFLETDANNDIYVGGSFMGTCDLQGGDSMLNTSPAAFSLNDFLLKISSSGTLLWKKNVAPLHEFSPLTSMSCDQLGNLWFALEDFMNAYIYKSDATGNISDSLIVNNCKSLSGIAVDASGIFLSGSTEQGTMMLGTSAVNVAETYMMFIARLHPDKSLAWSYTAHDVTFQSPQIVHDGMGGVYFCGHLMDSTRWQNITFNPPQWNDDFFLTRVDSSGNFLWGRSFPVTAQITGSFSPGNGKFLTADPAGNAIIAGMLNGSVDWGNGMAYTGQLGLSMIHAVAFDRFNTPLWHVTGGSSSSFPTGISASSQNEIYIAGSVNGICTFDTVSVNNGGDLAAIVVKVIPASVGIDAVEMRSQNVFPNPATDFIRLPQQWLNREVQIFSVSGSLIRKIMAKEDRLSTVKLLPGVYILRSGNDFARFVIN